MFVDLVTDHQDRFSIRFWNYTENEPHEVVDANGMGRGDYPR